MSKPQVLQPLTPIDNEEKWDHCTENFIRKVSLGFVSGILPALLMARSVAARSSIVLFSTGIGAGIAYGEARYLFDHNVLFDRRHIIQIELFTPKK
ncbi:MICOS complex subunit Mic10 [Trypanosoma melophagium]|uniref:MICOS complex subunit Mic10 n=1 Tax=Trypanosoma melophagium TaxID=715481 RepID=UPI00351A0941|nr:MICOS complex subunit Mic10 [Trypanosoma melophagium]